MNFFKNNKEEEQTTGTINSYPKIVQEIHNDFFTASDRLIEEANDLYMA